MPSSTPLRIRPLWFRAWIVASIAWLLITAWVALPIANTSPSFETVESLLHPDIVDLRRGCTRYNQHVEIRMSDGSQTICFRSTRERNVYFKWFSEASELHTRKAYRKQLAGELLTSLSGFVILALALLAADWILRGAGKGFLFQESNSSESSGPLTLPNKLNLDSVRAAVPLLVLIVALWASLPQIGSWETTKKGLDAFGAEAAGPFFLSAFIVLLYRKTLHPLMTVGALLIFIPPAALLFYPPLKANGLDFLLVPFGVGCLEFARYAGTGLKRPSQKHSSFAWQLLILTTSYFLGLMIFSFIIYS